MLDHLKRFSFWIGITIMLLGLGLNSFQPEVLMEETIKEKIANGLDQQFSQLQTYLTDTTFLNYFAEKSAVRFLDELDEVVIRLEALEKESFALFLIKDEQVILHSSKISGLSSEILSQCSSEYLIVDPSIKGTWGMQSFQLSARLEALIFFNLLPTSVHSYPVQLGLNSAIVTTILPELSSSLDELPFLIESKGAKRSFPVLLILIGSLLFWFGIASYLKISLDRPWSILLLMLFCLGLSTLWSHSILTIADYPLLTPVYASALLGPSVAAITLNACLSLWLFGCFYRLMSQHKIPKNGIWIRALGIYGISILLLAGIAYWLKRLLTESQVFFNLENSLQISLQGIGLGLSFILVLVGVFLFVYTILQPFKYWSLNINQRLGIMIASIALSLPVVYWLDLGFPLWTWALIAFIFLVLFDLFIENENFNFTWLMVWIIMFSTLAASLSYKYILDKDIRLMQQYALTLRQSDDHLTQRLENYAGQDSSFERVIEDNYVRQYYKLDTLSQELSLRNFQERQYIQQFNKKPHLPFKGLTYLHRYDYIVFQMGKVLDQQGQVMNANWQALQNMDKGESIYIKSNRLSYESWENEGDAIILQRELGSYFKPLSLFAIFFLFFVLGLFLFSFINLFIPIVPAPFQSLFQTRNSLRNRIQLAVIGIILGSSIIIGMVSIWYFKTVAMERQDRMVLDQSTRLNQWILQNNDQDASTYPSNGIEGIRWNLYNLEGHLENSKLPRILQTQYMDPLAFEVLQLGLQPYIIRPFSQTDNLELLTSIKGQNGQLLGYLGVPYSYTDNSNQQELNNFVGSIFSLYVFFMFIAGGIAIWVANSITEPISKIGESLKKLQLGTNTLLVWKNNDEIGLLIQEYNAALEKLEKSTQQLRLSEREGAWREMAKQVAHEIKNPLTPMKLSVQYLLRAYKSNPDEIGPLLQRMANTLIEQIEGLTRIANEFSYFAKMPKTELQKIEIIAVLQSVFDLYKNQNQNCNWTFQTVVEEAWVEADKNQLIRVLNNLLTNAIQAIPKDRKGQINLSLSVLESMLQIRVSDNGAGIPEELVERVFYPNFTTKSSGTGLGLAMSRNIIDQFGGRIYFETKEGLGTSFFIELKQLK